VADDVGPPEAAPVGDRRRLGRRWPIIGAIAVVLLLIVGYVVAGAAAAGATLGRAEKALTATLGHQDSVITTLSTDPFKSVDFSSSTPDIAKAKSALTDYQRKLAQSVSLVGTDRAALRGVQPNLQGSWLTLPEQSTINRDRRRVDAALAALASAGHGLDMLQKESAFTEPFLDALAGFLALGTATNLAGVQAQLPATGASLEQAVALAKPPAVPTELSPLLAAMQRAVADLQAMVAAAGANDATAFNQASTSLDADVKALTGFDQTTLDQADQSRFQPLIDAYNKNLKIAAGG
jgi:hypothetical protein